MRDPARRVDPEAERLIEETRRFLEPYVRGAAWAADPDDYACDVRAALEVIDNSNMPEWARNMAWVVMLPRTGKRRGKPTRRYRDMALRMATERLTGRGYLRSRNEATRQWESAASIIAAALARLGERMTEKQVSAIVLKYSRD